MHIFLQHMHVPTHLIMTSESISFFHVLTLLFADTGVEQMTKLYQVVMEIRDEQTNIRNEQKEMRDEQKELAKKVPTVTLLTDLTPSDASTRKGGEIGVLWRALGLPDAAVEIPGEPYKSEYSMRKFSFSWAGKSLEKEGYDALKEHLGSNGFSDIHCVEAGERLVSGELFDVNVFELRKKLGSHGEPLIARVRLHGRTDFVALRKGVICPPKSHILRHMVDYAIEVKRPKDMETAGQAKCEREAMMQLIGLCVDNARSAPPTILTNMATKHFVFYLDMHTEDPLAFCIKKQICSSLLCAASFALMLAENRERQGIAQDFGRGPTPVTSPKDSVHAQDDDSQDLEGKCTWQDNVILSISMGAIKKKTCLVTSTF